MIILYGPTLDCADVHAVASFWRQALDYKQTMPSDEELEAAYREHPEWRFMAVVEDELSRHPRLLLQTVPEPKAVRNRVRFEVSLPADDFDAEIERLQSFGATTLDGDVMADPDGNEFEVRRGQSQQRFLSGIVVDALEPERMVAFWSDMLGFTPNGDRCDPPSDWLRISNGEFYAFGRKLGRQFPGAHMPPDGPVHTLTPGFRFATTTAPKDRKNRIHFDLVYFGDVTEDREKAFSLGATPEDVERTGHRGMFDPEGNEFCLHDDAMFD